MLSLFGIKFLYTSLLDIADILLASLLLYQLYKLVKGSMTVRMLVGWCWLYGLYLAVKYLEMRVLMTLFGKVVEVGMLLFIIVFQQEIKKILFLLGNTASCTKVLHLLRHRKTRKSELYSITPIVEAAQVLGGSNTGALLVFSKNEAIKFYEKSGESLHAVVSKRLLLAIFSKKSPLHDGAVLICNNTVVAARCILPVSEKQDLPTQLGLRHRAAIGMTEVTDALVLVVSEETGQFSVSRNGAIMHNLSLQEVRAAIHDYWYAK